LADLDSPQSRIDWLGVLLPLGNVASRSRVLPRCFHGQFSNANSHPKVAAKQLTSNGFFGCGSRI
jgi:hypothetical protein